MRKKRSKNTCGIELPYQSFCGRIIKKHTVDGIVAGLVIFLNILESFLKSKL